MPLAAGLISHSAQGYLGCHTPGHKQGRGALPEWRRLLGDRVFQLDLTELPGLDNLHDSQGIIREAEEAAAAYFGARRTFFLINGATAGILAVIMAKSRPGSKVVLPRTSHQAVIHGLILSGAQPVYLPVRSSAELGLPGHVTEAELNACLAGLGEEALVVLLHPNYYGLAGEMRGQVAAARRHNCAVLADEAHGAHFCTSSLFPIPALEAGADFAVQSAHKVLGSFTQTAFLHCRLENDLERMRELLRIVQSSSPSYLLMASLDAARCQCQMGKEGWEAAARLGEKLRLRISCLPGVLSPGEELLQTPGAAEYDPTRLVVNISGLGITGFEAAEWLRLERKILVEMADLQNLVFILGPADGEQEADILLEGLGAMAAACSAGGRKERRGHPDPLLLPVPRQAMTPRDAFFAPHSPVEWEHACGKIAAEVIAPYPPGTPVICPGEMIREEALDFLEEWEAAGGVWPGKGRGVIEIVTGS